jgi:ribosomal protein L11 methyltransferase
MDRTSTVPASATFMVSLAAPEKAARKIADRLAEVLDGDAVSISVFETSAGMWRVALYYAEAEAATMVRPLIADVAGIALDTLTVETIVQEDWVATSLAGLAPVRAGRFFVHGAHDRRKVPANALAIELEAALAFGTGHHGTTRGCLLALDRVLKSRRPRRILDVGTGTGVLAIAAAKASRRAVLASDIDPQAVGIARENARANAMGGFVEVMHATGLRGRRFAQRGPYDLILANILLGPLLRLAVPIARFASPRATVVLSGLLPAQANGALSAYRNRGLSLERRIDLEGWTTLILRRHADGEASKPRMVPSGAYRQRRAAIGQPS